MTAQISCSVEETLVQGLGGARLEVYVPEHPVATLVRGTWKRAVQGDPAFIDLIADDIEWHEIGGAPIVGKEAVLEHLATEHDWQIYPVLHDVLASDDHAVIMIKSRAVRNGRTFEYRVAEFYDLRDGMIIKRWAFSDDTQRIAEFFR